MHPKRRGVLLRYLLAGVILAASFGLAGYRGLLSAEAGSAPQALPVAVNAILPPEDQQATLRTGLLALEAPPASCPKLDRSLFGERRDRPKPIRVGLVSRGARISMAVIDGKPYTVGQRLPDGRKLAAILSGAVVLTHQGRTQTVPVDRPDSVALTRAPRQEPAAQPVAAQSAQSAEDASAQPAPTPAAALTPDEAVALLKRLSRTEPDLPTSQEATP